MPFWRQPTPPATTSKPAPLILVVDDDRDTRELYRAFFDLSGFRTAEAATGREALAVLRRMRPDVLLTDLVLPDLDGLAIAGEVVRDASTAHTRIILLTGYGGPDLATRAAGAGVERTLQKPCLPSEMLREVRRALGRGPAPRIGVA